MGANRVEREVVPARVELTSGAEGEATRPRAVGRGFAGAARRREPAGVARRPGGGVGARRRRGGGSAATIENREAAELLAALSDPTRRRILAALAERGEATATTLAGGLPVTRQAVVKHLGLLDRAGLVEGNRRGREVRYVVQPERRDATARWMAGLAAEWGASRARIAAEADG
jgi:DNA-binding transcriptional ArsR family regulator